MPETGIGSPHFTIQEVADGVYAAIATDAGFALCNSAIVDLGDSTVVFDSMLTPQAGADLRRAAERLTGHRVAYLINSHYHGDHVRGNVSFPSVRIVSTRKVRELIEERAVRAIESDRAEVPAELEKLRNGTWAVGPRERVVFEGWFEGILATPRGTLVPGPDLFVDDRLVLRGPKRELEVLSFGGGHSPSDVIAYLADERIGFLGDLLSVGFHPGVSDGDAASFLAILDRVLALGPKTALPGHGPLGGVADIERVQRYLRELRSLASDARRSGISRDEFGRTPVPPEFAAWNFSVFFGDNLRRVYDQTPAGS